MTDRGPFDAHADRRSPLPGRIDGHASQGEPRVRDPRESLQGSKPGSPRRHGPSPRNYAAAASLILLGYAFYATVPYATEVTRVYYDRLIPPASWAAFRVVVVAYLLLLPLYYATFSDDHTVKCRRFWQGLFALPHRRPTPDEAVAFRAIAVKAIFWPLMVVWLQLQAHDLTTNAEAFLSFGRFFPYGYCAIYHGLFVVDVLVFAVGYGVEHPWLRNEIRSVEPTLLGWLAALLCYPPLVWLTSNALGWFSFELPQFRSPTFQVAAAVAMLLGVGVYAWATLALGLRASNLTNRGIVTTGPYRWYAPPGLRGQERLVVDRRDSAAPEVRVHRSLAPGPRDPGNRGLERDLRAAGAHRRATPRERSRLPGLPLPGSLALHPGVGLNLHPPSRPRPHVPVNEPIREESGELRSHFGDRPSDHARTEVGRDSRPRPRGSSHHVGRDPRLARTGVGDGRRGPFPDQQVGARAPGRIWTSATSFMRRV